MRAVSGRRRDLLGAACGVLGPSSFVGAWAVGGQWTPGYEPTVDAISRLAAEGAPTRALMTGGFVLFGVLVPVFASTAARTLRQPALRWSVGAAGLSTLLVAATPLTRVEGTGQDALHAVWAGTGYVAMAVSPLLGALALRRDGHPRAALLSAVVGVVSAACLAGTVPAGHSGLYQRLGLSVVDAWYAVIGGRVLLAAARR